MEYAFQAEYAGGVSEPYHPTPEQLMAQRVRETAHELRLTQDPDFARSEQRKSRVALLLTTVALASPFGVAVLAKHEYKNRNAMDCTQITQPAQSLTK